MEKTSLNPQEILKNSKTIAIIGCSADPYRTSNYAAKFLMRKGFTIIPVNPLEKEILGEKCYSKLNDIPKKTRIDIVNVFRNKIHTAGVVDEVSEWKKKTNQNPVIWTQLDVSTSEAEAKAEKAELAYIRNLCIMVELDKINLL